MSTTAIGIIYYAIALSTTYDEDGRPHSPIPAWAQWLLCIFSPIAFALGVERVRLFDDRLHLLVKILRNLNLNSKLIFIKTINNWFQLAN